MKIRDIGNWKNVDENIGMLFFAQAIDELTFDYSLDSYKAPTTNAPYLLQEALTQSARIQEDGTNIRNLFPVLDELEARLRGNKIAKSLANLDINYYTKFDRNNFLEVSSRLSVLHKEISPPVYAMRCMELLSIAIYDNDRKDIYQNSRELVTTLVNNGMSSRHINRQCNKVFFDENKIVSDESSLREFFQLIFPHAHTFKLVFKIKTVAEIIEKDNISMFSIDISDDVPEEFKEYAARVNFGKLVNGQKFLFIEDIEALDPVSATEEAEERIATLHDFFRIFHHKESYFLSDEVLVHQCCVDGFQRVQRNRNRMQFVNDYRPAKAGKKLDELLKDIRLPRGNDRAKFMRVIDFHGMSVSAEILENQLLNLWISLETISPVIRGSTKIENVVSAVLPFTGLNYISRIFERLVFDLFRWNRYEAKKILNAVDGPERNDFVKKAICLVGLRENENRVSELFSKLGHAELLRYRIFELRKILDKPERVLKFIDSHQERVSWQIRRIYRTRNSIVHSGETPQYTRLLVENAHDYFDQVFNGICKLGSGDSAFYTFKQCFDFAGWQFDAYHHQIRELQQFDGESIANLIWRRKIGPDRKSFFG